MIQTVIKTGFFPTQDLTVIEQNTVAFLKKWPGWQVTGVSHQHLSNGVSVMMVMQKLDASENEMASISDTSFA